MNDRQRLEAIVSVVCRYLPPDGIPINEAMSEIISLIDPLPPAPAPAQPMTQDMVESCPYYAETFRGAYFDGWLKAEAAHGITKGGAA